MVWLTIDHTESWEPGTPLHIGDGPVKPFPDVAFTSMIIISPSEDITLKTKSVKEQNSSASLN
jgi:hypothetical protein